MLTRMKPVRIVAALVILAACSGQKKPAEADFTRWRDQRAARLRSEDGWLSLVGLHWLKEGPNRFGSAATNDIVLHAQTPPALGTLVLQGKTVTLQPDPASGLTIGGKPVTGPTPLVPDTDEKGPTIVQVGSVRFNVIERNGQYGLRVKDAASPARANFKGLEYFPFNPDWVVEARFEPFNPPRRVAITNVLGMTSEETSPGMLAFSVGGKQYRVQPILELGESDYFIIFKDQTSGKETYPAARYVYAHPPGPDGKTIIDFNRAYNPPCAFTPFATCPLPPPQNRLPVRVEAGEKKYAGGHA